MADAPQDLLGSPEFKAALRETMDEAMAEFRAYKKVGRRMGGREKREWIRRRALSLAIDLTLRRRAESATTTGPAAASTPEAA